MTGRSLKLPSSQRHVIFNMSYVACALVKQVSRLVQLHRLTIILLLQPEISTFQLKSLCVTTMWIVVPPPRNYQKNIEIKSQSLLTSYQLSCYCQQLFQLHYITNLQSGRHSWTRTSTPYGNRFSYYYSFHYPFLVCSLDYTFTLFTRGFPSSLYTRPIDIIYLLGSVLPFYRVHRVWKHPIFNYSNMAQLLKSVAAAFTPYAHVNYFSLLTTHF